MATTTATPAPNLAALRAAHEKTCEVKERAWEEVRDTASELQKIGQVKRPDDGSQTPSRRALVQAQIRENELKALALKQLDAAEAADEAEQVARDAVRAFENAQARVLHRQQVARCAGVLLAANKEFDALAALHARYPLPDSSIIITQLLRAQKPDDCVLDHWFRTTRENGLIDEGELPK